MDKTCCYYRQSQLCWCEHYPGSLTSSCFALKGGTAINLFIHDFPRLSVDIDLAWIPLGKQRGGAAQRCGRRSPAIAAELEAQTGIRAVLQTRNPDEMRIIVTTDDAQIKIEVSPVAPGGHYILPQERGYRRSRGGRIWLCQALPGGLTTTIYTVASYVLR